MPKKPTPAPKPLKQGGKPIGPNFLPGLQPLRQGGRGIGPNFHPQPLRQGGRGIGPNFIRRPDATLEADRHFVSALAAQPRRPHGWFGLGYLPDVPDRRDYAFSTILDLKAHAEKLTGEERARWDEIIAKVGGKQPARMDLRDYGYLTPVEDQGAIGSCTAQAVVGLAEYLIFRGTRKVNDLSRMFLYKATRNLMGVQGDTGAYIRTTIQAMAAFGVPPEERWPYDEGLLDYEPMAFQYAYAANYKAVKYARLDAYGLTGAQVLANVKRAIAAQFPVAFGFPVYESIEQVTEESPLIPMPGGPEDGLLGGHAVLAVGYDDAVKVPGSDVLGALLIRNSWSTGWGEQGYGYLPYGYVTEELAVDFWTIFSSQWLVEGKFK